MTAKLGPRASFADLVHDAIGPCPIPGWGHAWTDHRQFPLYPGGDIPLGGPLITDPAVTPWSISCWRCNRASVPDLGAMQREWVPRSLDALERLLRAEGAGASG